MSVLNVFTQALCGAELTQEGQKGDGTAIASDAHSPARNKKQEISAGSTLNGAMS